MTALSNFLENKLLDHSLSVTAYTMPGTIYMALFTTDPTDAGSGTEVSGNAYTREQITFVAGASGATSNAAEVLFPEATGSWGSLTHWGIFDASGAGNLLWHGAFTQPKTIGTGDTARVAAGSIDLTLD